MKGKRWIFEIHKHMWITMWKWWISSESIDKMRQWILLKVSFKLAGQVAKITAGSSELCEVIMGRQWLLCKYVDSILGKMWIMWTKNI